MSINLKTTLVTTTPYNVLTTDQVILVNVNGLASIVLPSNGNAINEDCCGNHFEPDDSHSCQSAVTLRRAYYIKDYSGQATINPITITSAGAKTIDGVAFAILNSGYSHIQVVYDGTNWKTIA